MIEKLDQIGKDHEMKILEQNTQHKSEINKKLKEIQEIKDKNAIILKTQIDKGDLD